MKNIVYLILLLIGNSIIYCQPKKEVVIKESATSETKIIKLINGNWFNGESFEPKTVLIKNGVFRMDSTNEENVDSIIDLNQQYVIPPFAEAHNHNLESDYGLNKRISSYLENGVFYVKLPSTIKKGIAPLMHHYNKPSGLDISMAMAPLTASGGHPIRLRQYFLEQGYFDDMFNNLEEIEYHGYVKIDSMDDLNTKWNSIMSFNPDFIKINLLYSEEYSSRKHDDQFFGKKGLNPKLVPAIVTKAHSENLRVTAHVETTYDFRIAVEAGVDEIAHLPEISQGGIIDQTTIDLAKEKNVTLVTTASLITKLKKKPNYNQLLDTLILNLNNLNRAGVTMAIGSDMYNDNSVGEMQLLHRLDVFTNLELLRMWTYNSAKTVFPNRKIGEFREGYEASLLVLDINPLEDMSAINNHIRLRIKQGFIMN